MNVPKHIDGVVTAMDSGCNFSLSSVKYQSIIPLTILSLTEWLCWEPPEHDVTDDTLQTFLRKTRRLEPIEFSVRSEIDTIQYCFHIACECGHVDLVRDLLDHNRRTLLSFLIKDTSWMRCYHPLGNNTTFNALRSVASNGHVTCMMALLKFDPSMTKTVHDDGTSALHHA
eukprot:PhF_6_TR33527/c0_g2_i1/m.48868